jgi:hypothetical protein
MYPGQKSGKVWQVQVRPTLGGAAQNWVTVFDLAATSGAVAQAVKLDVAQGAVFGTTLSDTNGVTALVASAGSAGAPMALPVSYRTPPNADALHVVTDLQANTRYQVSAREGPTAATVTIANAASGNVTASPQGVLAFTVSPSGAVKDLDVIFADGFGQ